MPKINFLDLIDSFLRDYNTSNNAVIWPEVLKQVKAMRERVLTIENNINDLSKIHFNKNDTIDSFQENIYFLDESISNYSITSQEQLANLVKLVNNMLDYITFNKDDILALEWVKLNNVKNSFRAIQTVISSKITIDCDWLNQIINRYNQIYSYIIPKLPTFVNTKVQTEYLDNLSFENFDNDNKKIFITMIQDLRNVCQQVLENTDTFKKLDEWELNELQYSLEKLLTIISSKLLELDTRKNSNSDNLIFPRSSLTTLIITINKTKEKVIRSIKRKVIEKNLKSHIENFPVLEKESLTKDIDIYKNFIEQTDKVYNFIIVNKDILWEIDKDYIIEIKNFLENIKDKLDYVLKQQNPNNTDHLKFSFPAKRLLSIITWLIEKLGFNEVSFQN